ncbi:MAG TPA: elongation factor G, partial [Myxococcota bacterium]|nr:elongation factor G [Myxococcota bacterium]
LQAAGIPCIVVITKPDKERADYAKTLAQAQASFGAAVVPMTLPIGSESSFKGIVDLLSQEGRVYTGPTGAKGEIPGDMASTVASAREQMIEKLAEQDDELMMKYLDGESLTLDELKGCLSKGLKAGGIVPVLAVNAATGAGVDLLMDLLSNHGPSPLDRTGFKVRKGDAEEPLVTAPDAPFYGYVFKTIMDPQQGKISILRVLSGSLAPDGSFANASTGTRERYGVLSKLLGKKQETVTGVNVGDIVSVVKLKDTRSGHSLAADEKAGELVVLPLPQPCITYAIKPKSQGDEDKVSAAVQRLVEEDIGLRQSRDDESKEFLLHGLGQSHIQTAVEKLKKKFNVDVDMKLPHIPYRETIRGTAKNVEGKHKKQSGGRGQFGVCYIDMEPTPRGTGFVFEDAIFGGSIPRQFIPAVEKGIRDSINRGVVSGYPVVDFKVKLIDGKYHDVDSDARSFEMAGSRGFKAAFKLCKPIILEPIMELTISIPDECLGDIMGDVSSRRGRITGTDAKGRIQIVKAHVPMSECQTYATDLRSMTSDRGTFTATFDHYEELPPNLAEKLIAEAKLEEEEE